MMLKLKSSLIAVALVGASVALASPANAQMKALSHSSDNDGGYGYGTGATPALASQVALGECAKSNAKGTCRKPIVQPMDGALTYGYCKVSDRMTIYVSGGSRHGIEQAKENALNSVEKMGYPTNACKFVFER